MDIVGAPNGQQRKEGALYFLCAPFTSRVSRHAFLHLRCRVSVSRLPDFTAAQRATLKDSSDSKSNPLHCHKIAPKEVLFTQ